MPVLTPSVRKPSPIDGIVDTLRLLARNRRFMTSLCPYEETLEDIAMMFDDGMIIGLRSPWVRRVAVPVLSAQRSLLDERVEEPVRVSRALSCLKQCTDIAIRDECTAWILETFDVA